MRRPPLFARSGSAPRDPDLARRTDLWRHRDFLKLWSAETVSRFGSEVSNLATPFVAIVVLRASAFEVALLNVLIFLPFLLFTLPAGVWIDRLARRPILVASDLMRAVALASIPLAYAGDALTMWQLYLVAFVVGIGTVTFDVSYQSYLPSLVGRDQLVEGNSKLELSRASSQIGGPGLAGGLIGLLTAPVAVLVDAISFAVSAVFLVRIRTHEEVPPREERRSLRAELMEGLRYLLADRRIRALASSTVLFNFFGQITFSIYLVYVVRELGLGAGTIGVVFALGNVGGLAAAVLAPANLREAGRGADDRSGRLVVDGADSRAARASVAADSIPGGRPDRDLLRHRPLQHHRDQLPAGDHPRPDARAAQRDAAVPRLGRDPARRARGRRAGLGDRAAGDARRRRDRRRVRGSADSLFAAPVARSGSVSGDGLREQGVGEAPPRQLRLSLQAGKPVAHRRQSLRVDREPGERVLELVARTAGVEVGRDRQYGAVVEIELAVRISARSEQELRPPQRRPPFFLVELDPLPGQPREAW